MITAIDPGPVQSAIVQWDGAKIGMAEILPNETVLALLPVQEKVVIEMIASYGMAVGADVFETCVWIGRYMQECRKVERMFRREVKLHICASPNAKDSNIRQALIDRFGPPGVKKVPGITYGLKKDTWQAFALAVTWWDRHTAVDVVKRLRERVYSANAKLSPRPEEAL